MIFFLLVLSASFSMYSAEKEHTFVVFDTYYPDFEHEHDPVGLRNLDGVEMQVQVTISPELFKCRLFKRSGFRSYLDSHLSFNPKTNVYNDQEVYGADVGEDTPKPYSFKGGEPEYAFNQCINTFHSLAPHHQRAELRNAMQKFKRAKSGTDKQ